MTANDIYRIILNMVLISVSPNTWRDPDCPRMVVEIKCPQEVQDELFKLAVMWKANQAELETKLFSALVLDGIWHNIMKDATQESTLLDNNHHDNRVRLAQWYMRKAGIGGCDAVAQLPQAAATWTARLRWLFLGR